MSALGIYGAGLTVKFGDRELTFSSWTQHMMDAFEEWFVGRIREERMTAAEAQRKKARALEAEALALRARGVDEGETWSAEQKEQAQKVWVDKAGESQALNQEAHESVNEVGDRKSAGFYHFYGQLARQARTQFPGAVKIAHLSLLPKHPDITIQEVEQIAIKYWDRLLQAMVDAQEESKKKSPTSQEGATPGPTTTTSANLAMAANESSPATIQS